MAGHRPGHGAVTVALAGLLLVTGSLSACSQDDDDDPAQPPTTPTEAPIVVSALEPLTLMPSDIRDPYGIRISALLHRGLMRFDAKGKAVPEVADSVETDDDQVFTVRLRRRWTFTTGEAITASTFVNSWNFVANPANRQAGASALAPVYGYAAMRSGPAASRPKALAGLRVIDERTLRITLATPTPTFPTNLAQLATVPLPPAALADPKAYALAPTGNGPYRLAGTWRGTTHLSLIKNMRYRGGDAPRNDGLVFRYIADPVASYAALKTGTLDVLDPVPLSLLGTYRAELKTRAVNQPVGVTQSLAFPVRRAPWNTASGVLVRRAISMTLDRDDLITRFFGDTGQGATDLAAPVVEGYSRELCGDVCRRSPVLASGALRAAGGFFQPLTIAYSADSGDGPWVEAVCTTITDQLAIRCTPKPYPNQAGYAAAVTSGSMTGPYVETTTMSRPALTGFLSPRFLAGDPHNGTGYARPQVQALLNAAEHPRGSDPLSPAVDAEQQLLQDLPVIPLWTRNATGASGDNVQGVKFDVFGRPIYTEIARP